MHFIESIWVFIFTVNWVISIQRQKWGYMIINSLAIIGLILLNN